MTWGSWRSVALLRSNMEFSITLWWIHVEFFFFKNSNQVGVVSLFHWEREEIGSGWGLEKLESSRLYAVLVKNEFYRRDLGIKATHQLKCADGQHRQIICISGEGHMMLHSSFGQWRLGCLCIYRAELCKEGSSVLVLQNNLTEKTAVYLTALFCCISWIQSF